MSKKFFLLLISSVLFGAYVARAEKVDQSYAQKIARNFMMRSYDKEVIRDVITYSSGPNVTMYAFNFEEGGFVLLSASFNSDPILAYSDKGYFPHKDSIDNVGVVEFIEDCENKIVMRDSLAASQLRSGETFESKMKWEEWSSDKGSSYFGSTGENITKVSNLLFDQDRGGAVAWDQNGCAGEYSCYDYDIKKWYICNNPNNISYNAKIPAVEDKCEHAIVGCVPLAIAQVLWKWKYPETVTFKYKNEDITSYYNWDSMPSILSVESSIINMNEISTLLRDCGYMLGASFGCGGTSSSPEYIVSRMVRNNLIGYNCYDIIYTAEYSNRTIGTELKTYSISELTDIFEKELIAGRPIILSSYAKLYPELYPDAEFGHSYVVTGFEKRSDGPYFTINFGWGGTYDDVYYNLDFSATDDVNIDETEGDLFAHSRKKVALIGLSPKKGNENGEHKIEAVCANASISDNGVGRLSFNVKNANSYILTIKYKGKKEQKLTPTLTIWRDIDVVVARRAENLFNDGTFELWYSSNATLNNEVETDSGIETSPTTYQVTFFNNFGEVVTYSGEFSRETMTKSNAVTTLPSIEIFPNPSNGILSIVATDEMTSVVIANALGVQQREFRNCKTSRYKVNVDDLPSGIYWITVNTTKSKIVKQIILK